MRPAVLGLLDGNLQERLDQPWNTCGATLYWKRRRQAQGTHQVVEPLGAEERCEELARVLRQSQVVFMTHTRLLDEDGIAGTKDWRKACLDGGPGKS
jgi:hypothetical protein